MIDQPRVLMVEDVGPVLGVFCDVLGRVGFEVESAQTATEAVDLLATRRYAVIVADCFLPDLPPLDWLAALRGVAPTTPVVIYSGSIRLDELEHLARDWRAVAVLEKPFTPATLVAAVRGAVAHQHDGRQ